ncbi:hypothetical protein JYT74_00845 [Crocinitomix catalasitica]|nr:hypothetical protein [Crocinitomix catalasitica]
MKCKREVIMLMSFSLLLGIISCAGDPLDVDVSDIELELEFDRFEKELTKAKSVDEMFEINEDLHERGGELYEFYVSQILGSGAVDGDSIGHYLWYFISDSMMRMIHEDIEATFANFGSVENRITDIFKRMKYHLPEAPVPVQIITYNSTFRYGVTSTPDRIGIGLDMYLGENNRVIQKIGYPLYMKAKMHRDYLPVDVGRSWLIENVMAELEGDTFLSNMIYYGKLQYAIDALMPDLEDHLQIRYTLEEYDYALASEYNIWQYLLDMNWIYETDIKVKMRFFDEAPTTVGIDNSPGRIGQFMGWRIVKQYMEKNEDVTVEELLSEENEGKILKAYKAEENE